MKKNLHELLRKQMELAITDYDMVEAGDRILVGISGGADSFTMLNLLSGKKIYVSQDISIIVVHIDLGFDPHNHAHIQALRDYLQKHSYEYHIERSNIGPLAHSDFNRRNPCFLCTRLRRKRLFEIAAEKKCNKIALGHHKDDLIETLLINIFFGRQISTMKPKQDFFKGEFYIIRPLVYIWEKKIKPYAQEQDFPLFENKCPTSNTSKRQYIKNLLHQLQREHKLVKENIFKAMKHVKPDYLL